MPRIWPGFFAVWAAIILHLVWTGSLLVNAAAGNPGPAHPSKIERPDVG